jgi:hypothetical protein
MRCIPHNDRPTGEPVQTLQARRRTGGAGTNARSAVPAIVPQSARSRSPAHTDMRAVIRDAFTRQREGLPPFLPTLPVARTVPRFACGETIRDCCQAESSSRHPHGCFSGIASVAAQRGNRRHLQRVASREVAGHQCHSRQREDDQCERQRIRDRDAPEKAAYDGHHHE